MSNSYFETPNMYVPLNDREKGELAQVALDQLMPFQNAAESWPIYSDGRCNRCKECHENIWFTTDPQGHKYIYTEDEIMALKTAHIRQCHEREISGQVK